MCEAHLKLGPYTLYGDNVFHSTKLNARLLLNLTKDVALALAKHSPHTFVTIKNEVTGEEIRLRKD